MRTYLPVTFPQNRVLQAERLFLHSDQYIIRTMYFFQDREPEFVCGVLQAMLAVQQDLNSRFHISADGQEMLFYVGEPDLTRVHHVAADDDSGLEGLGFFRGFASVWDAPLYEFFVQSATNSDGPGTRVWAKLHHALADGTSLALLGQRIADACAPGAQGLAPGQVTSGQEECLHEENSYHAGRAYTDDAAFWANHIGSSSEFPEDLRGDDQTCDSMDLVFEPELTQALVKYTKSLATPVSTYCLGLALLGAYLLRRFDSDAVPVLTASAGRRGLPKAIAESIRMQVNTLLLHCTRKAEETFGDFVLRVDTMLGQALKHSRYPLGKVVEHLHNQGEDTERLWNFYIVSNACPDLPFDIDFPAERNSPFGLIFRINLGCDDRQGLQKVRVVFRRGAMNRQAVERMIEGIRAMAADLVAHPHKPVDRLALIGPKERQLLVDGLQTPPSTWGRAGASFVDYLREAAARYPGHIALCDSTEQLTYAEVDAITDRLAAILEAKGPVRGRFVALGISRCNAFALAIYAVLKAGGAYLPLDPDYPLDRVQYMLEDSQAPLLLVDAQSPQERRALPISGLTVLDIKELMEQAAALDSVALPAAPHSSDPAYIIYTSGSTGKPKGVVISHRALSAFIAWNIDLFALGEHSRVALHSSFSFDAAVIALFPPLCAGGQLHSIDERTRFDLASLYEYLGEHGITDMFLTTQICVEFLQQYQVPGVVISTGGEKLKAAPNHAGLLFNGYGPTECTVISTCHLLDASRSYSNIPIGRPMPGVWHYIMDRNQELLPLGMSGELCLAGPQCAEGYLNRPETTATVFMPNPVAHGAINERMYRTGDLVAWNENHELEYYGRFDDQIKLRGFRIELGEIESAIQRMPGVRAATVVVRGDMLAAYFQADHPITDATLRATLAHSLPEYMIPAGFMQLELMPLTPNGKIDRKKLPALTLAACADKPLANDLQRQIGTVVAEIINNNNLGADTNLYQAGMSSLAAIKIAARLEQETGVRLHAKDLMHGATIENMEALIVQADPLHGQEKRAQQASYPLSKAQLGIYYDSSKNPESLIYNIPLRLVVPQDIDCSALAQALRTVVDAHAFLKTRLVMEKGQVRQERRDEAPVDIPILECASGEAEGVLRDFVRPFDLFTGLLFRFVLCCTPDEVWLLADFHHLVFDGFSADVFLHDLTQAYAGLSVPGEESSAFEISLDEAEPEAMAALEQARQYYQELLADIDGPTMIPVGTSADAQVQPGLVGRVSTVVDGPGLTARCSQLGITPGSFFLGAAGLVISRFVSTRNLLISTIHSGRDDTRYHRSTGMLVKTLPLVLAVQPELCLADYFSHTHQAMLGAIEHQAFSFSELTADRQWKPEINFAFQGGLLASHVLGGHAVAWDQLEPDAKDNTPKFPFAIEIDEQEKAYGLIVEYDTTHYDAEVMETFVQCLAQVVKTMCALDMSTSLASIGLMTQEQTALVASFSRPIAPANAPNLHGLLEAQALKNPQATALVATDRTMTFAELNRAANNLAGALSEHGVEPEDRIAFILPRTSRVLCAIFGILKAGCAFIPVDPEYPADRVRHILDDSGARYILTQGENSYANSLDIDSLLSFDSPANPGLDMGPERLAYLIYTSGSTGKPKGVMISHGNAMNYMWDAPENFHVRSLIQGACTLVSIATISFDAFLEDVFCTLLHGLPLVFASQEETQNPALLAALYERTGGDAMDITQSRLLSYMELPAMAEALSRCKVISAGGEKYPPILYERLRAIAPNTVLINSYGPTETTIACNCTALTGSRITIGPPLWNVVERIVDMDGHDLPPGVVGELWIGGQGVGRGYFGNPELTARHFVEHNGTRYYRSGDLGKWTTDGQVVILGRNDGQIKLRGLRIELGEIENVLAAVPGIRACAVVVRSIAGREHLCAYYTASRSWEPDALRTLLSASLARYMVPTAYLHMDKLPETPSGKTDLKSLPEPLLAARREYIAPRTDTERIFCDIFAKVLGLDTISADDDFFDLGGTSLLVTRVVILALEHGLELTFGDVFSGRTPEGLAAQKSDADHVAQAEQQEHEYEYSAINSILAENTLDAFGAGSCRELGNVALTGATGFLGIHILREYLRSETGLIQCLVRGGTIPAQERLQGLLAYYFEDRFEDAFANRIRVVEGDVTDVAVLARLGERPVDTLINCAANVKHFAAGSEIEEINVGGVRHCLDFCHEQGCRFIQISTTSVAGMSVENEPPEDTVLTEQMLYFGQNLDNKYIHSKFLAERLTLDAVARRGVDAKIMRVGNLMARQDDGEFQINFNTNSFVGTLRAYYRIGKIPFEALGESAEFTPVDSTARAILHLSRTPAQCRVFHPTNNHNIFIGDVIWALKQHGISITPCEMNEFEKAYSQALHNPNLARELAPLIAYSNMAGNRRASSLESTNAYTTQMLYRLGFTWPVPGQGYLGRFMGALSGLGFFD